MELIQFVNCIDVSIFYHLDDEKKVERTIKCMRKRKIENKLTLLFDINGDENAKFEEKFREFERFIRNNIKPNTIKNSIWLMDFSRGNILRYPLPQLANKAKKYFSNSNSREYDLSFYKDLYNRYSGISSNYFSHRFLEYNSSYVPAFGTEFRVTPTYVEAGFGRGKTNDQAKTLSTIEAFERYINMYDRKGVNFIRKSYSDMSSNNTLNPKKLILHTDKEYRNPEFKLKEYSDELPIDWVKGRNLTKNKEVYIPKNAVWFGEKKDNETSNVFSFETSNGMAVGGTEREAIVCGIYELIERDCFLRAWYGKTKLKEIDWKNLGLTDFEALSIILNKKGQFLHVFDITGESKIPTFWVMLKSEDSEGKMAIYNAAGCNLDPVKAISAGLYEVITSFPIYEKILKNNSKLQKRAKFVQKSPKRVTEFQDHVLYYACYENAKKFNYLLNNGTHKLPLRKKCKVKNEYLFLKRKLEQLGYEILIVNVTPKFLYGEKLIGVKTIIPGLMPMTFGEQYRRISEKKIKEYNELHNQKFFQVNEQPHPFP